MLMKKNRKTIVVLVLFLGLLCYTVFALHALPAAPVEAEFADQIQYEEAFAAYEAQVKQTHAYLTIGLLIVGALALPWKPPRSPSLPWSCRSIWD